MHRLIKTMIAAAATSGGVGMTTSATYANDACCPGLHGAGGHLEGSFGFDTDETNPGFNCTRGFVCPFEQQMESGPDGFSQPPSRARGLRELAAQILLRIAASPDSEAALNAAANLVRATEGSASDVPTDVYPVDPSAHPAVREAFQALIQEFQTAPEPVLDGLLSAFARELRATERYSTPRTFELPEQPDAGQPGPPPSSVPELMGPSDAATDEFPAVQPLPESTPSQFPREMRGIAGLSPEDQVVAFLQGTCPVGNELLGGSGTPLKVEMSGRPVFVCSDGCLSQLRSRPQVRPAFQP